MNFDIKGIIKKLSSERPIFHSEADFQFALAWKIKEIYSNFEIRLEKRKTINGKEIYFDIFAFNENHKIAIELKYKTQKFDYEHKNEHFELKEQSAQDQGGYDFLKDISRLEQAVSDSIINLGFAIFLTNDKSYWKEPKRQNVNDIDFKIYNQRQIYKGQELRWKEKASKGTTGGRGNPIFLNDDYKFYWESYSQINNHEFKYLLVKIKMRHNQN